MSVDTAESILQDFRAAAERREAATVPDLIARVRASDDVGLWRDVGTGLVQLGAIDVAGMLFDAGVQRFPQALELRYWLGNALRMSGQRAAAEHELRAVLAVDPRHLDAATSLAFMLREAGRIESAAEIVVEVWRARSPSRDETVMAMTFLRECGAHARALELAREARSRWPDDALVAAIAGDIALAVGEFASARAWMRAALARDPEQSASWLRLAHSQRFTRVDDPDFRRIEVAASDAKLSDESRICASFALGKALDDLGEYASATDVLRVANAGARLRSQWRADAWERFVDRQIAAPVLPVLSAAASGAEPGATPVFVIGLPRTGTTLVASLLERHPEVRNRGELNWIASVAVNLETRGALRDPRFLSDAARFVGGQLYRDDAPARCYIDKNPLNFRHLGLIAALFPNARIVHCRRDARDTALSNWIQHFAHEDLGFAYDFADIAAFARGYGRLMAHWRTQVKLPMLEIDYETLVGAQRAELGRLARFLELAPEPLLDPASAPKSSTITTASVWQARQPVHTGSVARWKHYAKFLPELTTAFPDK